MAKVGFGLAGAVVFGVSMVFARVTYAGHSKRPIRPLPVPPRFYSVIRQNLLQGGIVAPATAPPDAATSSS